MASKIKFPGGSQSLCWILWLGNLLWVLEISKHSKNFFGTIVLQFVGCVLGGYNDGNLLQEDLHHTLSLPGLLQPLLTRANAGDTQTLKGRTGSVSVGSLGPGVHKVLFEPSEHLWPV